MTLKEMAKEERTKLKTLTFKGKLQYFWDYYKMVLVVLVIVGVIISIGVQMYQNSRIKTGLYLMVANTSDMGTEESPIMTEFPEYAGFGEAGEVLNMDTSLYLDPAMKDPMTMSSLTKVMAVLGTGDLDVMILPEEIFEYYAKDGIFADLSQVFTGEEQDVFKEYFLEFKGTEDTKAKPYGLRIEDGAKWKSLGIANYSPAVFCVIANAKHIEASKDLATYLLK